MTDLRPVWWHAARIGLCIAAKLRSERAEAPEFARVLAFFEHHWERAEAQRPSAPPALPFERLCRQMKLGDDERTLLLLALMPEAHEGFGAAFAALHPRGESRPSWGLFGWLVGDDDEDIARTPQQALLAGSPLLRLGLVRAVGEGPWPERSLVSASGLWAALLGLPLWPVPPWQAGEGEPVDDWLATQAAEAAHQLAGEGRVLVLLQGSGRPLRLRAQQLAGASHGALFELPAECDPALLSSLLGQCMALDLCPLLLAAGALPMALIDAYPAPLLIAGLPAAAVAGSARRLLTLDAPPLSAAAQAALWQQQLPELAPLAGRHAVDADALRLLRQDLTPWLADGATPPLARSVAALKARTTRSDDSFARRIVPQADWDDLVLPPERMQLLRHAVQRMEQQRRVLDDWGFGARQPQARGLRLLFSGLPGTGKTLAAEVVAHALHADLLVIDLSRLVSKWIGETEKNLAAAFDQAEGTGAVLFFDEADALFGKRTEVSDAHDRYANLESAYLLARLERFDGVAVLATNLRANLDKAFLRRFELTLDFAEPGPRERAAIWGAQFPEDAPRAEDLKDFNELANTHALPGALIRNAALGAAFMAAAEGSSAIARRHVEAALRVEYDKSGRVGPN